MAQPFRPGELSEREARALAEALSKLDSRDGRLVINAAANVPVRSSNWTSLPGGATIARAFGGVLRSWFGASSTVKPVQQPKTLTPPPLPGTVSKPGAPPTIMRPTVTTTVAEEVAEEDDAWEYMIGSSNVYAFRYAAKEVRFYVCFLGGSSGARSGEGPTYSYSGVPKKIAMEMLQADSAGGAVWDHLRVRGAGNSALSQYDFRLEAAGPSGYIPRRLTGVGMRPRNLNTPHGIMRSTKQGTGRYAGE